MTRISDSHPAGRPVRRTFLIPSIPDLAFAGLVSVQVALASVILLNRDGDLPRHIVVGRTMLESGALVRQDFFSHTAYGQAFLAYEWLSQVIFAAIYGAAGLDAIVAFAAVVIAVAYALITGLLIRRGVAMELVVVTMAGAVLSGMPYWAARPHIFTFLGAAILLCLVQSTRAVRVLWFVPLFAIWANLHPGFLFGLGILGLLMAGATIEGYVSGDRETGWRQARFYGAALGLGAVASLLTPYGWRLHTHSLGHLGNAEIISAVAEFRSPDFHAAPGVVFLLVVLLVLAAVAARGSRLPASSLLILLATLALALQSRRNITLFGIVTLPLVALTIADDWRRWAPGVVRDFGRALAEGDRIARRGGLSLVVVCLLAAAVTADGRLGREYVQSEFNPRVFPIDAVRTARAQGVTGTLFNDYMWGGYITLAWPERPVFIDGLADFYGTEIFRDYATVAGLKPGWRDVLGRRQVDLVLMPAASPLAGELMHDNEWRVVYRDQVAALLQRQAGTLSSARR